ncbi:MAG TPA: hypothetical protein VF272_01320 [Candidatus Saccharimonadia bacterium]
MQGLGAGSRSAAGDSAGRREVGRHAASDGGDANALGESAEGTLLHPEVDRRDVAA